MNEKKIHSEGGLNEGQNNDKVQILNLLGSFKKRCRRKSKMSKITKLERKTIQQWLPLLPPPATGSQLAALICLMDALSRPSHRGECSWFNHLQRWILPVCDACVLLPFLHFFLFLCLLYPFFFIFLSSSPSVHRVVLCLHALMKWDFLSIG